MFSAHCPHFCHHEEIHASTSFSLARKILVTYTIGNSIKSRTDQWFCFATLSSTQWIFLVFFSFFSLTRRISSLPRLQTTNWVPAATARPVESLLSPPMWLLKPKSCMKRHAVAQSVIMRYIDKFAWNNDIGILWGTHCWHYSCWDQLGSRLFQMQAAWNLCNVGWPWIFGSFWGGQSK